LLIPPVHKDEVGFPKSGGRKQGGVGVRGARGFAAWRTGLSKKQGGGNHRSRQKKWGKGRGGNNKKTGLFRPFLLVFRSPATGCHQSSPFFPNPQAGKFVRGFEQHGGPGVGRKVLCVEWGNEKASRSGSADRGTFSGGRERPRDGRQPTR